MKPTLQPSLKNSLRIQIPVFVFTRTLLNTAIRMVYPFLPAFARSLGVGLEEMTWAVSLRSLAGGVGPFLASIADSRGRKTGILAGLALYTAGAACPVFWPGFPGFVLALLMTMGGNFVFVPSLQAYLGDRVPYERRGLALSLTEFGWSLSLIAAVPMVGLLIDRRGALAPFPLLAGSGALAWLLLAWLLPSDPPRTPHQAGPLYNLWRVASSGPARAGILTGLAISAANESINLISGVWMESTFGLRISELGAAFALIGFSELGGEALVSGLSDRIGKTFAVSAGLVVNSLAVLALALAGRTFPAALICLIFFYLSFEFTMVSSIPLMTGVLPQARATMMAVYVGALSLGRGLGALISAPLYLYGNRYSLAGMENAGILLIGISVAAFNLLAWLFLRRLAAIERSSGLA